MFQIDISRIIDDTRSTTSLAFRFLTEVLEFDQDIKFTVVRNRAEKSTAVSDERFDVDYEKVTERILGVV